MDGGLAGGGRRAKGVINEIDAWQGAVVVKVEGRDRKDKRWGNPFTRVPVRICVRE